nr:uncharacterized protein LOC121502845 [Drosophila kikkawai]
MAPLHRGFPSWASSSRSRIAQPTVSRTIRAFWGNRVGLSTAEAEHFPQLLLTIPEAVVQRSAVPTSRSEWIPWPLPDFLDLRRVLLLIWFRSSHLADPVSLSCRIARHWRKWCAAPASKTALDLDGLLPQLINGEKQGSAWRAGNRLRPLLAAAPVAKGGASFGAPSHGSGTCQAALDATGSNGPVYAAGHGSNTTPTPVPIATCGSFAELQPTDIEFGVGGTPAGIGTPRRGSSRPRR